MAGRPRSRRTLSSPNYLGSTTGDDGTSLDGPGHRQQPLEVTGKHLAKGTVAARSIANGLPRNICCGNKTFPQPGDVRGWRTLEEATVCSPER
jgi:hypothetical protein